MSIMNFMKKPWRIKIYIGLVIIIILITIVIIILSITRKKDYYYYLTINDSYYLECNNTKFDVRVYSNHDDDIYLNKEVITSIYLKSRVSEDFYELDLSDLTKSEKSVEYNDKTFYENILNLKLPIITKEDLQLNDCYLELRFLSEEIIKLNIGSIIVYNIESSNHLEISHMKAVVNKVDEEQILSGIGISVNASANLTITDIKTLDTRVFVKSEYIKRLENDSYLNSVDMSELLGVAYDPLGTKEDFTEITINNSDQAHYIIPLFYEELISINKLGFRIEYEIDGVSYTKLVYPFKFFATSQNVYQEVKYVPTSNT